MRFIVDECTGPFVADWLRNQGYSVFSVFEDARGMTDDEIISKACDDGWVLISNDKDFGEQVYRCGRLHKGVILLRLKDERASSKIQVLSKLLDQYQDRITDAFVVVTEKQVRFAKQ